MKMVMSMKILQVMAAVMKQVRMIPKEVQQSKNILSNGENGTFCIHQWHLIIRKKTYPMRLTHLNILKSSG